MITECLVLSILGISEITSWKRNRISNNNNEEVYKLHLLRESSIRHVYQKGLQNYVSTTQQKMSSEKNWRIQDYIQRRRQ